jgi:hypothetical protein
VVVWSLPPEYWPADHRPWSDKRRAAIWFAGSIDDVRVYQGIETDTAISEDYLS